MNAASSVDEAVQFHLEIDPPDTKGNFKDFNRQCDQLDSDFLMQPVNEAEYDSETQACVDRRTGATQSYYDHYVTKRKKKKGLRVGIDCPVLVAKEPLPVQDSTRLTVPNTAVPAGSLSNVAIRRIACGRMPPQGRVHGLTATQQRSPSLSNTPTSGCEEVDTSQKT